MSRKVPNLNFVFSDENRLPKARIEKERMLENSIYMVWKTALHEVVHKIAPECSEHQVDYTVTTITRKTVS